MSAFARRERDCDAISTLLATQGTFRNRETRSTSLVPEHEGGRYPWTELERKQADWIDLWKNGDQQAFNAFLKSVDPLISMIARRKAKSREDRIDDFKQEITMKVLRRIPKYDRTQGRPISYLFHFAQYDADKAAEADKSVVPTAPHELTTRWAEVERELRKKMNRLPTEDEIAVAGEFTDKEVARVKKRQAKVYSGDRPIDDGKSETTTLNRMSTPATQLKELMEKESSEIVQSLLRGLDKSYREVVSRRYGLGGRTSESQVEIAKSLNLSKQRIDYMEHRAFQSLVRAAGKKSLNFHLETTPKRWG